MNYHNINSSSHQSSSQSLERKLQLEQWRQSKQPASTSQTRIGMGFNRPSIGSTSIQGRNSRSGNGTPQSSHAVSSITRHQEDQKRSQLNQTNGNFINKQVQQKPTLQSHSGSMHNMTITNQTTNKTVSNLLKNPLTKSVISQIQTKSQLHFEMDLIYNYYKKCNEQLQQFQSQPQKLAMTFDPLKWQKKFILLFLREKVLDLCLNPSHPLDVKNLSLKPKPINKNGEKLLKTSVKFWVIYSKIVADKLQTNEENKKQFKETMLQYLSEGQQDISLLTSELQNLIDFQEDKENMQTLAQNESLNTNQNSNDCQKTADFGQISNDLENSMDTQPKNEIVEQKPINQQEQRQQQKVINETFGYSTNNQQQINASPNSNPIDITIQDIEEDSTPIEQQTQQPNYQMQHLLIQPPSQEYVVKAPVSMSASMRNSLQTTPNFHENKAYNYMQDQEEQEQQIDEQEQIQNQQVCQTPQLDKQDFDDELQEEQKEEVQVQDQAMSEENNEEELIDQNIQMEEQEHDQQQEHQLNQEFQEKVEINDYQHEMQEELQEEDIKIHDTTLIDIEQQHANDEEEQPVNQVQEYTEEKQENSQQQAQEPIQNGLDQTFMIIQQQDQQVDADLKIQEEFVEEENLPNLVQQDHQIVSQQQNQNQLEEIHEQEVVLDQNEDIPSQEVQEQLLTTIYEDEDMKIQQELQQQAQLELDVTQELMNQTMIQQNTQDQAVNSDRTLTEEQVEKMYKETMSRNKKRKRSNSNTSQVSQITTRSQFRRRKLNEDAVQQQMSGASYLRYEIIEKKQEQVLVPVRYSIRTNGGSNIFDQNKANDKEITQLERKILNNKVDFSYKPSNIESMFSMDEKTQEIQKLLKQRFTNEIQKEDILEVVQQTKKSRKSMICDEEEKDDQENPCDISIVKIKPEARQKYGGHEQVIASLQRMSVSPRKRETQMKNLLEELMNDKTQQTKGLVIANASQDAINFIKKSRK
eukprot:403368271